jgi:tripartite-type tricarboxylate transporter receptor subunit TctC
VSSYNKILKSPDMQTRFINDGSEPIGGSQEEFAKFIREEISKYAKLIKVIGIKPE